MTLLNLQYQERKKKGKKLSREKCNYNEAILSGLSKLLKSR